MVWIWLRIVNVGHLLWLLNDGASSLVCIFSKHHHIACGRHNLQNPILQGDNDMEHGCISDDMRARQSSIMNHES